MSTTDRNKLAGSLFCNVSRPTFGGLKSAVKRPAAEPEPRLDSALLPENVANELTIL